MGYEYYKERPFVFTEEGMKKTIDILERSRKLFKIAGACMYYELTAEIMGDTWETLACVDYLVETNKLRRVDPKSITQYQVFTLPLGELMNV